MNPINPKQWKGFRGLAVAVCVLALTSLVVFGDFWLQQTYLGLLLISGAIATLLLLLTRDGNTQDSTPRAALEKDEIFFESDEASEKAEEGSPLDTNLGESIPKEEISDRRVLLLSNDRSDRHNIAKHLQSWNLEPTKCDTAARAYFELIQASENGRPFHAVIVDRGRFDLDASQFSTAMRSEYELQEIYLILVGVQAAEDLNDEFQRLGYTRVLSVPLNKTLLFNALHSTHSMPAKTDNGVVRFIDHYNGTPSHQPLSILLAENNRGTQQRMLSVLQRAGHQVFLVDSGARVLDALDSHRFDLAMVSLDLREINGIDVYKLYRFTRIDLQWTPFILLLNQPGNGDIRRCAEAGIDATLEWDADSRKILTVVKNVVLENDHFDSPEKNLGNSSNQPHLSQENTTSENTALDRHRLMELDKLGSNTTFMSDLIDSFNRDNRHFVTQMQLAVENGDLDRFRDLGHAIKDSAGSLGALKLHQLGTSATLLRKDLFRQHAPDLVKQITECCRLSNNALQNFLHEHNARDLDYKNTD